MYLIIIKYIGKSIRTPVRIDFAPMTFKISAYRV
nr:MAG TPA: hypothetical protein [Caudoviricetes sp.]DAT58133.1 MAG TPA: hypothetical protein [Caudoviricetes sp.]